MDKDMIVFCFRSSWKAKKKKKKKNKDASARRKVPVIVSDGRWPLGTILHNTCSLFSTSHFLIWCRNKTKQTNEQKKKRDWRRAVLSKSDLWIVCFNGCAARNAGRWGIMRWTHIWRPLRASCTDASRLWSPAVSCPAIFYCNRSVIIQPSCKFLKLFTATEVLQILYNSVNVL